jgi:trans-aconitate 2-methyltransferase
MHWNVSDYERFRNERARPFFDLIDRLPTGPYHSIIDLGCGTGELTRALAERYSGAVVLGVDNSPEMLAAARPRGIPGRLQFEAGDAARFRPAYPVDLIVSNATLQWVPDHAEVVPRLANAVGKNGVLAVQMPANFDAPSHALLRETAAEPAWADELRGVVRPEPVAPLTFYVDILTDLGFSVDAWETTYIHILTGPDPVLGWVRGTALRPVLDALDAHSAEAFVERYAEKLRAAYRAGRRGGTLFPFRRIFFIARRLT